MGDQRHARLKENGGAPVLQYEEVLHALLMGAAPGGITAAGCRRNCSHMERRGRAWGTQSHMRIDASLFGICGGIYGRKV